MKTFLKVAAAAAAAVSLAACGTIPLTGHPAADAKAAAANLSAANANLGAFNQAAVEQILLTCGTDVDVSAALSGGPIPVPPTLSGKLDFKCHIAPGQLKLVNGQIVAVTPPGTLGLSSAAIGTPAPGSP